MTRLLLRIALGLLFLAYPFLVYLGLSHFDPRWLVLLLLVIAVARYLGGSVPGAAKNIWLGAALISALITLSSATDLGLRLYPVLVNLTLFGAFFWSYRHPPTVIELIARKAEPELPESGVAYTRKVTLVWCTFFLVNATISAYTVTLSSDTWALYNGLISYLMIAFLMALEWLVRQRVRRSNHHA